MTGVFTAGEKALLLDSKKRRYLIDLAADGEFHSHAGFVRHSDIIGQAEGCRVYSTKNGEYIALRPTLEDFVIEMPRGAQVIYPKDLGPICMLADIGPGVRVFETGIGSGALSMTMLRYGPEYTEKGETALLRGLLYGGRVAAVGLSTVVALLAAGAIWLMREPLAGPYGMPLLMALVAVPMFALTEVQDGLGRGKAWMAAALLPPYVLRPLLLLAAMLVANLAGLPMRAETAAGAAIFATWATAIVQTLMIERRLAATLPAGPHKLAFRTWLATSLPLLAIGGCEMILQSADVLIVSRFMTPSDVLGIHADIRSFTIHSCLQDILS